MFLKNLLLLFLQPSLHHDKHQKHNHPRETRDIWPSPLTLTVFIKVYPTRLSANKPGETNCAVKQNLI